MRSLSSGGPAVIELGNLRGFRSASTSHASRMRGKAAYLTFPEHIPIILCGCTGELLQPWGCRSLPNTSSAGGWLADCCQATLCCWTGHRGLLVSAP